MPGSRRTGSPTTSTSGTSSRHPRPDPVRQLPQPCRLCRRLGPHRPQRRRGGHDRREVLEPRRPPRLPLVRGPLGREPHTLAYGEQPDPRRAAPLVGARRQQRPVARHPAPAQRLRRVHQQRHPGRPAHRRPPRPPAAPCPPRGWPTADRPARCPARRASAYEAGATVPVRSTATRVTVPPSVSMHLRRMQHRRVFDR